MLPSALAGLVLFVALLTPGFIYDLRIDRNIGRAAPSQLREILRIVTASMLCNLAAFALFIPIRLGLPHATPSITKWIKAGNSYWQNHDKLVLPWVGGFLLLSCLLALFTAHPRIQVSARALGRLAPTTVHQVSAWSYITDLYEHNDRRVYVYAGCQLTDGSYVSGEIFSISQQVEEDSNRNLVLRSPILCRQAGSNKTVLLKSDGFSIISASKIVRLDVTHLDDRKNFPQADPSEDSEANPSRGKCKFWMRHTRFQMKASNSR